VAVLLVLLAAGAVSAGRNAQWPVLGQVLGGVPKEILTVPFVNGPAGVQTINAYSGPTAIAVMGVGQASGSQWSDAFYIFTDYEGNPIEPWHPTEFFNWVLWINGGPADAFVNPIPPYNPDHVYVFTIDAPGGPLTLAVGDAGTDDNTGQYDIGLRQLRRPLPGQ
jgi:hypothetical protein